MKSTVKNLAGINIHTARSTFVSFFIECCFLRSSPFRTNPRTISWSRFMNICKESHSIRNIFSVTAVNGRIKDRTFRSGRTIVTPSWRLHTSCKYNTGFRHTRLSFQSQFIFSTSGFCTTSPLCFYPMSKTFCNFSL